MGAASRLTASDRREHRRPAHVIDNHRNRARHAADDRVRVAEALGPRRALAEMRKRVSGVIHAPEISGLGVAMVATPASVRQWGLRTARTPVFSVAVITCLVGAVVVGAAPSPRTTPGPAARSTGITSGAAFATVSDNSAGSWRTAEEQPLTGAAPPLRDLHSEKPGGLAPGVPVDNQGLRYDDDAQWEMALIELDRDDRVMYQQRGLDQPPPVPAAGPAVALPGGQPAGAPSEVPAGPAPGPAN